MRDIQADFTFIVGDHRYASPWIITHFLSPMVARLQSADPSIAEYGVEAEDSEDKFGLLISLAHGSAVPSHDGSREFLLSLSRELCNVELYHSLAIFSRLAAWELDQIPLPTLSHILSQEMLTISSEDSLCSYVCSRIPSNPEYSTLIRFIRLEYLSRDSISTLISLNPLQFGRPLWDNLWERLKSPIEVKPEQMVEIQCPMPRDESLVGIISRLHRKCGGSVHEKEIVTVTSKSVSSNVAWNAVVNVLDFSSTWSFSSKNEPNQWACWDFHNRRVRPTH
jgi:hypothetical protein